MRKCDVPARRLLFLFSKHQQQQKQQSSWFTQPGWPLLTLTRRCSLSRGPRGSQLLTHGHELHKNMEFDVFYWLFEFGGRGGEGGHIQNAKTQEKTKNTFRVLTVRITNSRPKESTKWIPNLSNPRGEPRLLRLRVDCT